MHNIFQNMQIVLMNSEKIYIFIIVMIIPRRCITVTHSSSAARPNINLPLPSPVMWQCF